jgi:putative two-component system response regulator
MMGLASGFLEARAEMLLYASMMHDIGKVGVPDAILRKPGKLTHEEFEIMKTHSLIGADIIGEHDSEVLMMARDIALMHHEKWNGQGYPYGKSGNDISIVARIVTIADVFDALISVRPYKPAWSIEVALEQISLNAGEQFDPELVRMFIGMEDQLRKIIADYSDTGK